MRLSLRYPKRRSWRIAIATALLTASALLVWALLWPDSSCAQPACASQRFNIAIEVDALQQVAVIPFDVPAQDQSVSLRAIMNGGGIETAVTPDDLDLPYKAASGPLDRADLYRFAAAWGSMTVPSDADAKVYALLAAALVSDTGEPLFGIMFDVKDRQGFAVAPPTTAHQFSEREPDAVPLLQLRTFTHELLHTLNRRHFDAVQMRDGRLTLEAPTRCISEQEHGQWFLREPPLMEISPGTIRFFQTAASRDILPGEKSSPFSSRRASPTECDELRGRTAEDPARTRWELATRRLRSLFLIRSAAAAETEQAQLTETEESAVELRIQAMPAAYPLGYPIAIRVLARNVGHEALPIKGRLNPSYGVVRIEYRRLSDEDWNVVEPLAWFEPVGDEYAMLLPGERTEQTVPIYFGEGWTFPQPGDYEVRARLQLESDAEGTASEPVQISVVDAHTPDDEAALRPLLSSGGRLNDAIGRLLSFGGRIVSEEGLTDLEAAVDQHGDTALGSALRLTLVSQRLRPPIDPLTGERPAPDLTEARELLRDTCTDSGVAALKKQLLERHAGGIPSSLSNRAETAATAWDGISSMQGDSQPTYSDPALKAWGPSLHFCLNEAQMREPLRVAIPRLAKELQRANSTRVVIAGHSDYEGSCRYNDALGMRRADEVRRALLAGGLRVRKVDIASLGERRPLDFASSSAAHDLNRRVEILVEGASTDIDLTETPSRVAPRCLPEKRDGLHPGGNR
jgi:outer membrane protein OmpA-like peptidoglycan-associated protein